MSDIVKKGATREMSNTAHNLCVVRNVALAPTYHCVIHHKDYFTNTRSNDSCAYYGTLNFYFFVIAICMHFQEV